MRLPGRDLGHQRHAGDRRAVPRCWPIPKDPASIARAIVEAAGPDRDRLRDAGPRAGPAEFTWARDGRGHPGRVPRGRRAPEATRA